MYIFSLFREKEMLPKTIESIKGLAPVFIEQRAQGRGYTVLRCCFFATVRIPCGLTDDDLAGFAVLTHHVETLTEAREAGAEIAAVGRVDGGSGGCRGRDGGDATGC